MMDPEEEKDGGFWIPDKHCVLSGMTGWIAPFQRHSRGSRNPKGEVRCFPE